MDMVILVLAAAMATISVVAVIACAIVVTRRPKPDSRLVTEIAWLAAQAYERGIAKRFGQQTAGDFPGNPNAATQPQELDAPPQYTDPDDIEVSHVNLA